MVVKTSKNNFTNVNAVHWKKWLRMKSDSLPVVTFFFLSRKNATSARYLPLLDQMGKVRIVLFNGSRFGKFDYFQMKAVRLFIKLTNRKQRNYKWIFVTDTKVASCSVNQILNIDDPLYNQEELKQIFIWENKLKNNFRDGVIIVTNETTKRHFLDHNLDSNIMIIEQGHSSNRNASNDKFKDFTFVYSSPYIDIYGDKHGKHPTWGVNLFIKEIIPKLIENDPQISIHLIGHLGNNAYKYLSNLSQVTMHGYKTIEENYKLLTKCNVALYPRTIDNNRRVLKIYEYIGANLPIISFNLEDTKPVSELNVGISVDTVDDFIAAVLHMKENRDLYSFFLENLKSIQNKYSWSVLAKKFDELIVENFKQDNLSR
jgi:glycosyltransferase involved in cell wall biosynthesis